MWSSCWVSPLGKLECSDAMFGQLRLRRTPPRKGIGDRAGWASAQLRRDSGQPDGRRAALSGPNPGALGGVGGGHDAEWRPPRVPWQFDRARHRLRWCRLLRDRSDLVPRADADQATGTERAWHVARLRNQHDRALVPNGDFDGRGRMVVDDRDPRQRGYGPVPEGSHPALLHPRLSLRLA